MIVLGLNAYHGDASACVLRDGKLIAAVEEERFRRIKHWAGFPSESIRYCLEAAGASLADVDHVALNSDPRANRWHKIAFTLRKWPTPAWLLQRVRNTRRRASVAVELSAAFPSGNFRGQVHRVEHHRCHLASAFLVSPFADAVALSVDGFGDFTSAAWGFGDGAGFGIDGRVLFPHSLGTFYEAITQFLGFPNYGDEYKVMGLAPYGKPGYLSEMRKVVGLKADGAYRLGLEYFRHHNEVIPHQWNNCSPSVGTLYSPALETLLGPARGPEEPLTDRHFDIAHSAQAMYEEAFFHLLEALHGRYRCPRLVLAGGCAMNSVANGKIRRRSAFRDVYVQAAAGDAGGAVGAALLVDQAQRTRVRPEPLLHAYWGPRYSEDDMTRAAARCAGDPDQDISSRTFADENELCAYVASAIAAGRVVGWFQDRMEWGPRALGNRSILGDPRRADMKDILNRKIKRRESFRPFAPSILRHAVGDWFEEEADVPFMSQVFQIRETKRSLIPAVTHVDGSGRLQTVHRDGNPRYFKLIEAFEAQTGVPLVLNTSFNENEPIVCNPAEAVDCFSRTRMDMLVLGDMILERPSNDA